MLRKALTLLIAMLAVAGFLSVIVSAVVIVNLRTTDVKGISGAPPKPMLPLPMAEERYLDLMKRVLTRYGFEAYERRGGQRGGGFFFGGFFFVFSTLPPRRGAAAAY